MASELYWFPLYTKEWVTDIKVRMMGPIARAYYLELLIVQWEEGKIPGLARACDKCEETNDLCKWCNSAVLRDIRRVLQMPRDPMRWVPGIGRSTEPSFEEEAAENDLADYDAIIWQVIECFEDTPDGSGMYNKKLDAIRQRQLSLSSARKQNAYDTHRKRQNAEHDAEHLKDKDKDKDKVKVIRKEEHTPQAASERFVKPSFDELHAYCVERGWKVDPQQWLAHYEANGWKVGKNPMKDWKAAVRTWEHNGIERSNGNGNRESAWLSAAERRTRDTKQAIANVLTDFASEGAGDMRSERQRSIDGGTLQRVGDTMPLLRNTKPQ